VIVKNMAEAEYVAELILGRGDHQEFLEKFKNAISDGFDPATMLDKVGIANQTTMLKGETEAIGKLFQKTMLEKHGPAELDQHFVVMDTICDATQTRQDAMYNMVSHQARPPSLPHLRFSSPDFRRLTPSRPICLLIYYLFAGHGGGRGSDPGGWGLQLEQHVPPAGDRRGVQHSLVLAGHRRQD